MAFAVHEHRLPSYRPTHTRLTIPQPARVRGFAVTAGPGQGHPGRKRGMTVPPVFGCERNPIYLPKEEARCQRSLSLQ